ALNPSSNQLSTIRRQTGILVDVHPVLRGITEASQLQLPRSGPDGQPTESPHLGEGEACPKCWAPRRHAAGAAMPRLQRHSAAWLFASSGVSSSLSSSRWGIDTML